MQLQINTAFSEQHKELRWRDLCGCRGDSVSPECRWQGEWTRLNLLPGFVVGGGGGGGYFLLVFFAGLVAVLQKLMSVTSKQCILRKRNSTTNTLEKVWKEKLNLKKEIHKCLIYYFPRMRRLADAFFFPADLHGTCVAICDALKNVFFSSSLICVFGTGRFK